MNLTFSLQSSTEKIREWKKGDKTKTPDPLTTIDDLVSTDFPGIFVQFSFSLTKAASIN